MSGYDLKAQIKNLNSSMDYYKRKINSCQEKLNNLQRIEEKYPGIEYYGGKIFYLKEPSLAKKITFSSGHLQSIDYKQNYTYSGYPNYKYSGSKFIYSYFLDGDLKIFCDKNIIFTENGSRQKNNIINIKINDYSKFFEKSNCKDKLIKATKKLLLKHIIEISKGSNINILEDSFEKEKIQGMLLFK